MNGTKLSQFLRTLAVLTVLAIVLSGVVSPPDPFSQLLYGVPLLLGALLLSYVRTYTGYLGRSNG